MSATAIGAVRRRAILCVLAASASFSVVATLIKAVGSSVPAVESALCRGIVMGLIMIVLLRRRNGGRIVWRTRHPWGHAWRTVCGFFGMVSAYYGYAHLPLAANTALGFAMPLVLGALSGPLLGERVGWVRGGALVAGLVGVLMMVRPWNVGAAALPLWPVAVVLAGVVAWAGAMISIRRLGVSGESNESIILYYAIGSVILASGFVIPVWVTPSPLEFAGILGAAVVSTGAQLLMTEGYRTGEATVIAPFEYGSILYTTLIGLVIWGEIPDIWSWLGISIIIASGLYVWHRETMAGRTG
jgi:drug/metabolite transporter (DMT)-like permease